MRGVVVVIDAFLSCRACMKCVLVLGWGLCVFVLILVCWCWGFGCAFDSRVDVGSSDNFHTNGRSSCRTGTGGGLLPSLYACMQTRF